MPATLAVNPNARAELTAEQLSAAFHGAIRPPRTSPVYLFGLALVAGTMVLLPLIYFAMIAGIGFALYNHVIEGMEPISEIGAPHQRGQPSNSATMSTVTTILGLVVGVVLILFLLKPLFAPRRKRPEPFTLDRGSNPLIYSYVEGLCRAMGAPCPVRIDVDEQVNASAGFGGGWFSMLSGRVVLTIGLPLAGGMDVTQLTGVLAHEFGHFTQRVAMRLGWIIARINNSLGRFAYERDEWDERLRALAYSRDQLVVAFAAAVRTIIWITRLLLRGLVLVAHAISCFMSRQMEYDADAWQCRVVGSRSMVETSGRISVLAGASSVVFSEMQSRWNEKRMPDDIPAFIVGTAEALDAKTKEAIEQSESEAQRRWFHTHPTRDRRVAAAEALAHEGVFRLDAPASGLFSDFATICKQASYNHYSVVLGEEVFQATLAPTEHLLAQQGQVKQGLDDAKRFAIDERLVAPLRIRLPASLPVPGDAKAAASTLRQAREAMRISAERAAAAAEEHAARWSNELVGYQARAALAADIPLEKAETELGFRKGDDATLRCQQIADLDDQMHTALDTFREQAAARVTSALRLMQIEGIEKKYPGVRKDLRLAERMLETLYILNESRGSSRKIMRELAAMERLIERVRKDNKNQKAINQVLKVSKRLHTLLFELRGTLSTLEYPFPHSAQGLTLGSYMVEHLPVEDDVNNLLAQSHMTMGRFWPTYYKALGPLLSATLRVEEALGWLPIPMVAAPVVKKEAPKDRTTGG